MSAMFVCMFLKYMHTMIFYALRRRMRKCGLYMDMGRRRTQHSIRMHLFYLLGSFCHRAGEAGLYIL
jgi:hypothetical protein